MKRRTFLQTTAAVAGAAAIPATKASAQPKDGERPNILWISCEDMSPDLGCYGDEYAHTPNLDALAEKSVLYTHCFAHAPVCAPARSGIITGVYPTTMGTHLMRCNGVPEAGIRCFTEYLRIAGYYCTNNSKTDYQFNVPFLAWDESSGRAHWRNRPDKAQPFFTVMNFTSTHESQTRSNGDGVRKPVQEALKALPNDIRHDPAKAPLPSFYPDTPDVRADVAQHYDTMTIMDGEAGRVLKQLEEDGLADDTIVIFWSDHGRGMPRYKRWPYDSGLRVAFMIHVPEKWRAHAMPDYEEGSVRDDLVSFIDFAPTVLNLAGVEIPDYMAGQPVLGPDRPPDRDFVYAARDRMDERYDMIRVVRDKRFLYVRNYMAHMPYAQTLDYMERMPTMQDWRRLNAEGKLNEAQALFFRGEKPLEELYDCNADPDNVKNLADDPDYADELERLRSAHDRWAENTNDVGLVPEPELDRMKWPDGRPRQVEPPKVQGKRIDGEFTIRMEPRGGTFAGLRYDESTPWIPWHESLGPIPMGPAGFTVKASRIGYVDSAELEVKPDGSITPFTHSRQPPDLTWFVPTELLQELRRLRANDYRGADALPEWRNALSASDPSVIYWGIVGVMRYGSASEDRQAVSELLDHRSPAVRIAAAEALGKWGEADRAVRMLARTMLRDEQDSTRHFAACALSALGEDARAAVPQLKESLKDNYKYVARVSKALLLDLGEDLGGAEVD